MKVSSLTIEMAANVARLQKDMEYARRTVDSAMGRISDSVGMATKALGFLGAGAGVSGLLNMARDVSYTAQEFERLAQLANTGTETMQAWSYGAKTAGVQQEKLSDILKDVNDKVGEFTQTGSGPLKDFFEQIAPKVGVTADQFARLGGPEALQLYATSLEKAGVSQQQATFYMEALASDSTALLPLLNNNGAAMNGLAAEARNMGLVMSEQVVAQAVELARQSDVLDAQLTGVKNTVAAEIIPTLTMMTSQIVSVSGESRSFAEILGGGLQTGLRGVYSATIGVVASFQTAGKVIGGVLTLMSSGVSSMFEVASRVIDGDFAGAWAVAKRSATTGGAIIVDVAQDISDSWVRAGGMINGVWEDTVPKASALARAGGRVGGAIQQQSAAAAKAAATELKAKQALYASLMGVSADYVEQLGRIQAMRLSGMVTDEQSIELATRLIEQQKVAGGIMEANAKWAEETAKANADAYEEQLNRVTGLEAELKAQRQANEAIGLSGVALAELEAARQRDAAAELERRSVVFDEAGNTAMSKLYEQQARALRELADARVAGATKQVAVEAAKKAEEAWKATTDQISQSLTDALMRGFEDGKGFGENFVDSLENMLKTKIARALQQAIAQGLSGLMNGQGFNFGSLFGGQGGFNWSSLFSGNNWASTIGSALGYGSTAGAGAGTLTYANAVGAMGGDSLGALAAANNQWAGVAASASEAAAASQSAASASSAAAGAWAGWAAVALATSSNMYKAGWNKDAMTEGAIATHRFGRFSSTTGQSQYTSTGQLAETANVITEKINMGILKAVGTSDKWAQILSGVPLTAGVWGRKLKGYGYDIDIAGGAVDVGGYEYHKGGLFRSNKTIEFDVDPRDAEELRRTVENVRDSSAAMAKAMGYSDEAIESFTGNLKINFKGAETAAEQSERYNEALQDLNRQMINAATGANYTQEQFDAMMSGIQEDMAAVGISAEGIADILVQGMMGKLSQQEVGDALADMMVGGIYESIAQNYAGQIAQAFTGQILTPIFTALAAGVPISQAISQQAIANVVATAQQAAAALNAIFNDAGFRAAIAGVEQAIGGVSGAVTKVKIPKIGSARSAGRASGPSPAQIEADRIAQEREGLERQLLQLQGDTVELRRRELEKLAPANRALQERIWALEEEQRISQEREGLERRMLELNGRQAQLRAMDLAALDASNRALQEHVWALEDQASAASQAAGLVRNLMQALGDTAGLRQMELEATNPAASYLQEALWAVEDAAAAEEDARQKVEEAKSALRDAYERERGEIQQTIDKFDAFARSLKAFRQQLLIDNNSPLSLTQRQAEAERQFADVARRARLGDVDAIEELQGISSDYLAVSMESAKSAEDYYRSFAKVQNVIEDTESLAKRQIDVAKSQLSALERLVAAQIDINNSVLSVEAAVNKVVSSIGALAAATTARESATTAAQQAVEIYKEQLNQQQIALNAIGGDTSAANSAAANEVRALYDSIGRVGNLAPSLAEIAYWAKQNATGDDLKISFLSAASGATGVYASSAEIANELLKGIRGYASGGVHSGGLRIVGENGPELELTGPSRIWSAEQTQRMLSGYANDELVAEVRQLRKETAEMKSAAAATARNSNDTVKILQRVTNGGNAMLTEAIA